MKYKRVLLKLSGEALSGSGETGINFTRICEIAEEIKPLYDKKVQIALVIGAGNIWRGAGKDLDRVTADYMGMLATVINSLALCEVFRQKGISAQVQSAFEIPKLVRLYERDSVLDYLEKGHIVILAGGTGNPYFTTDTTAALRACEIRAEVLLKATQVDGVYDDDPRKKPTAKKYAKLSFDEAITKQLKIMDTTAFSLCKENSLPIIVFDFHKTGNLNKVLSGDESVGTLVE